MDWTDTPWWLAFGLLGNATFASRFLVQWIASERAGESVVPEIFWYLSIVGSFILLLYAIHLKNLVFTLAYLPNAAIYMRNLALIRRKRRLLQAAVLEGEGAGPAEGGG
ncbi:MAG: lipid-A-disaccharide synthase N-terminal domain-containing protein [Deltaproteobacteria bacterium]|nr:lipid-A-disaccharide synthase N-terminal domain-containing protein [Deltaproteobacteria bacterium]MBW2421853.1 lipid-A-disaccharide synthase N-terminal domain-containing protein [Deltaproteobacteria bacterium]